MAKRKLIVVVQAFAIGMLLFSLLVSYDLFSGKEYFNNAYKQFRKPAPTEETHGASPQNGEDRTNSTATSPAQAPAHTPTPTTTQSPSSSGDTDSSKLAGGNPEHIKSAPKYINAILDPEDKNFPRLDCPRLDVERYQYLKPTSKLKKPKFFIALNIRQKADLLPRLMGSIVETLHFFGPENCVLSIVEGNSNDGTYEILKELASEIEKLGTKYHFDRSDLDPGAGDRIKKLAELRNMAIAPLVNDPQKYASDTTVLFLNDVAICLEDILELAHQRLYLSADMTCGFDWTYVGPDPTFYDVWISRTIAGDSFFEIPPDGNWNSAWNIFWNEETSRRRFFDHKPIQVFSCWNGAVAMTARPLLDQIVRFRAPTQSECFQGEPQLFCKDLWYNGFGKIAVIPSVNLEYSDDAGRKIKASKGYTSQWVGGEDKIEDFKLDWKVDPPEKVKCIPSYDKQTFEPWNQGLE
ncbi:alpha-mannosyltransferase cmt1 [Colletotrichum truncatum]|uniref:Alpha-mannosyltransferase cmt1 n=1 Tax=Colletotrichum truncatum TaxID=5467 RepID=A0ACC3ZDC8_COLTU|nr:alpha-mannosyltransferase cmt1 [Colletotrichum truncatum]KAF6794723.1 alpha-mannosyltransferase cmt1 [Colletotrichum truncatum]